MSVQHKLLQPDIPSAKILKVLGIVKLLCVQKLTLKELCERFDTKPRTMYRYIRVIESCEIMVEKNFHNQYFIHDSNCPYCGKQFIPHSHNEQNQCAQ